MSIVSTLLRVIIAFLVAVVATTVLAVMTQSLFVMLGLLDVGAPFQIGAFISMVGSDLIGLGPVYAIIIAIGFLIALVVARLILLVLPDMRVVAYSLAGAVCMIVILIAIRELLFGVQLIAGARTLSGLLSQVVAGGVGGYVFARLSAKP
jgi:hypothetical protein